MPKRFDVIRITGLKKIELGKNTGKEKQWLINITAPFEVVMSNISAVLGSP